MPCSKVRPDRGTIVQAAPLQRHSCANASGVGSLQSRRVPLIGSSARPAVAWGGVARSGCQPLTSNRHVVVPAPNGGESALTNSRLFDEGSKAISPAIGVGGGSPSCCRCQWLPLHIHV